MKASQLSDEADGAWCGVNFNSWIWCSSIAMQVATSTYVIQSGHNPPPQDIQINTNVFFSASFLPLYSSFKSSHKDIVKLCSL